MPPASTARWRCRAERWERHRTLVAVGAGLGAERAAGGFCGREAHGRMQAGCLCLGGGLSRSFSGSSGWNWPGNPSLLFLPFSLTLVSAPFSYTKYWAGQNVHMACFGKIKTHSYFLFC